MNLNFSYLFRCTMPDGRLVLERRGGERCRLGRMVLSSPELDEVMGQDGRYFTLADTLQAYDANHHAIGKPFFDPLKRQPAMMPPPKQVEHDHLVAGCKGYLAFDVLPARHSGETQLRGVWLPALLVGSPSEVLLASGDVLPAMTPAIRVADPARVPAGNFVLSKSGHAWVRDSDGPRSLGVVLGQVQPLGLAALEGGHVAVQDGAGWRVEELA